MQSKHAMREKLVYSWCCLALVVGMAGSAGAHASDPFMKPTPEELAMTSLPGYPGAPAVVLYREEIDRDDDLGDVKEHYERIKILTEEGAQKYANVELYFVHTSGNHYDYQGYGNGAQVGDIVGRTIHPDGTIVPFTGKPYLKTIVKAMEGKSEEMVFTLPDVEIGSIIEYRYAIKYGNWQARDVPAWYIQGDLFVMSAHYSWHADIYGTAAFKILPPGAKLEHVTPPMSGSGLNRSTVYDLVVRDVPPQEQEEYMPPLSSYGYRVLFTYGTGSSADFWKEQGKSWSEDSDSFMKGSSTLAEETQKVTAGAATTDEKLRKIYAKVMTIENTKFTREREREEDGKTNRVTDVLKRNHGSSTELAALFVAMAREAGIKSYLMLVPDRSQNLFTPYWRSFEQFESAIAIIDVDGKDQYLDPGSRYCPYGHLEWKHTLVTGLRQVKGDATFSETPADVYGSNVTLRVASLDMDARGDVSGKIDLTFTGGEALTWRQSALKGDEQSVKDDLRKMLEDKLPKSLEVTVGGIQNLEDYEQPLKVSYGVKGKLGAVTGKRMIVPVDIFESGSVATFPQDTRETAVYFHFPQLIQDALRINFPAGFEMETAPMGDKYEIPKRAVYSVSFEVTPSSITTRRNYAMGDILFMPEDYAALRSFYAQMETKDKESVVLKTEPGATLSAPGN
jgi:hypothetical protein